MIKVAYVLGKLHSGGKKNLVMEYYRHMDTDKIRIDFICDSDSNSIPEEEVNSLGGKVFDSRYYSSMLNLYYGNTWNKNALRRWQHPGDVTDIPRIQVGGSEIQTSSYLIDASYFAIKNITLGYTLPAKWTNRIQVSKVRIYGSVDNLVTFTHLKGMDPQYNLSGNGNDYSYVPNKNFTIGLDINF